MTYLILNILFIAAVVLALYALKIPIAKRWYVALIPLLILTALFDPIIIYFDIVGYDTSKILGLTFFGAPLEDFMYSILAAILVPSIWNYMNKKEVPHD